MPFNDTGDGITHCNQNLVALTALDKIEMGLTRFIRELMINTGRDGSLLAYKGEDEAIRFLKENEFYKWAQRGEFQEICKVAEVVVECSREVIWKRRTTNCLEQSGLSLALSQLLEAQTKFHLTFNWIKDDINEKIEEEKCELDM